MRIDLCSEANGIDQVSSSSCSAVFCLDDPFLTGRIVIRFDDASVEGDILLDVQHLVDVLEVLSKLFESGESL